MSEDTVTKFYPVEGEVIEDGPQPEVETLDFDNSPFKFTLDGEHDWKQRGYYAHCTRCGLGHGIWIGPDKLMVGTDDKGMPILRTRDDSGNV